MIAVIALVVSFTSLIISSFRLLERWRSIYDICKHDICRYPRLKARIHSYGAGYGQILVTNLSKQPINRPKFKWITPTINGIEEISFAFQFDRIPDYIGAGQTELVFLKPFTSQKGHDVSKMSRDYSFSKSSLLLQIATEYRKFDVIIEGYESFCRAIQNELN